LRIETTAAFFHDVGKFCSDRVRLKICFSTDVKITDNPFVVKPGMSSSQIHLFILEA
jgi:hypothetical protein